DHVCRVANAVAHHGYFQSGYVYRGGVGVALRRGGGDGGDDGDDRKPRAGASRGAARAGRCDSGDGAIARLRRAGEGRKEKGEGINLTPDERRHVREFGSVAGGGGTRR